MQHDPVLGLSGSQTAQKKIDCKMCKDYTAYRNQKKHSKYKNHNIIYLYHLITPDLELTEETCRWDQKRWIMHASNYWLGAKAAPIVSANIPP